MKSPTTAERTGEKLLLPAPHSEGGKWEQAIKTAEKGIRDFQASMKPAWLGAFWCYCILWGLGVIDMFQNEGMRKGLIALAVGIMAAFLIAMWGQKPDQDPPS